MLYTVIAGKWHVRMDYDAVAACGNILHMISGNVILVTCCQNRRKCSIAKLLETVWFWSGAKICKACRYRKKVRSVGKIELDTADNGPLLKTRRVFLAIFAFVLQRTLRQRTLRLNRKTSGSAGTKPGLQQGAERPETQALRRPLPICIRRTRPTSFD